jgi:hypothetical protein
MRGSLKESGLDAFCKQWEEDFHRELFARLFSDEPFPGPAPRKEFWMAGECGNSEMVVAIEDKVYKLDPEKMYEPMAEPYANRQEVKFWRPCTGFDF